MITDSICEDEYQGELENPQTLKLYVYTVNNPLKYVDPSGPMINFASSESGGITSEEEELESAYYFDNVPKPDEFYNIQHNEKAIITAVIGGALWGGYNAVEGLYQTFRHPIITAKETVNGIVFIFQNYTLIIPMIATTYDTFLEKDTFEKVFVIGSFVGEIGTDALTGIAAAKIGDAILDASRGIRVAATVFDKAEDVIEPLDDVVDIVDRTEIIDEVVDVAKKTDGTVEKGVKSISDDTLKRLNKGVPDNIVYYGIKNGEEVYTGITKQVLAKRLYQHNYNGKGFDNLVEQVKELTRNQARAIEQYLIENGPANVLNNINSISPKSKYYSEALQWLRTILRT